MLASSGALLANPLSSADSASLGIVCTEDGATDNVRSTWSQSPIDSPTST